MALDLIPDCDPHKKPTIMKKDFKKYLLAFVITAAIFITAIAISSWIDNKRVGEDGLVVALWLCLVSFWRLRLSWDEGMLGPTITPLRYGLGASWRCASGARTDT